MVEESFQSDVASGRLEGRGPGEWPKAALFQRNFRLMFDDRMALYPAETDLSLWHGLLVCPAAEQAHGTAQVSKNGFPKAPGYDHVPLSVSVMT